MKDLKLNFPTIRKEYDNKGAYETLIAMMKRGDKISVKFFTSKEDYPCAMVESKDIKAFPYQLKQESLDGIINYLQTKEVIDFDPDPMNVDVYEGKVFTVNEKEPTKPDFQLDIFKQFVESGRNIQYTPLFREYNNNITAIAPFFGGSIIFRVKRTDELLDYLRENGKYI